MNCGWVDDPGGRGAGRPGIMTGWFGGRPFSVALMPGMLLGIGGGARGFSKLPSWCVFGKRGLTGGLDMVAVDWICAVELFGMRRLSPAGDGSSALAPSNFRQISSSPLPSAMPLYKVMMFTIVSGLSCCSLCVIPLSVSMRCHSFGRPCSLLVPEPR